VLNNEQALARLKSPKVLEIVPGATHRFPEPGALEAVIGHACAGLQAIYQLLTRFGSEGEYARLT
jgi:hypothetical protein